jgi:TubC N-terminal docking domain
MSALSRCLLPQAPTLPTAASDAAERAGSTRVGSPDICQPAPDCAPTASDLLLDLRRRGVVLALRGNRISCKHSGDALTPELRAEVQANAPALIRLLAPKPLPVCDVKVRSAKFRPQTMMLVRHNRTGQNQLGQAAETHPFALINWSAWREADWNLAECRWYRDAPDAAGVQA